MGGAFGYPMVQYSFPIIESPVSYSFFFSRWKFSISAYGLTVNGLIVCSTATGMTAELPPYYKCCAYNGVNK